MASLNNYGQNETPNPSVRNLRKETFYTKKGSQIPLLSGTVEKDVKKKTGTTKEKKKLSKGPKKSGHSSTPLNSDDSEKVQAEAFSNIGKRAGNGMTKGHTKQRANKKNCRSKRPECITDMLTSLSVEDKADLTPQAKESLRWDGVLEDPVAEAERLEIYRANRRKRYWASRKTLLEKLQTEALFNIERKADQEQTMGQTEG